MKPKSTRSNKLKPKGMTQRMTKKRSINQKGGILTTSAGVNNSFFSKTSGTKRYDPDLGRMRNQLCYDILGFKFCRFDPDDINQPQQQQGQQPSKSWWSSIFS